MLCCTLWMWCSFVPAQAQERDPTLPPAEAVAMAPGAAGSAVQSPWGTEGMTVVVRDGTPFLVVDTRLVGVGKKVGALRIERITETEVWLREGATLRKVPRFGGIERREAAPPPQPSASAPQAKAGKARKMTNEAKAP